MIKKLTPDLLRRIVLEEKKKIEAGMDKKSKKAKKDMELDETEQSPAEPHTPLKGHVHKQGKKKSSDAVEGYTVLKEREEFLRNQLRLVLERKMVLRKKIISALG